MFLRPRSGRLTLDGNEGVISQTLLPLCTRRSWWRGFRSPAGATACGNLRTGGGRRSPALTSPVACRQRQSLVQDHEAPRKGDPMGVLDHRRQWRYEVAASPAQCVEAFSQAFTGRGGLVAKAKWDVRRTGGGAVAVYGGRKGLGALGGVLSQTAAQEQDTAIGSEVSFQTEVAADGRTVCSMWLSSSGRAGVGGLLGATSDARFIRPYMQQVGKELRAVDPQIQVTTG